MRKPVCLTMRLLSDTTFAAGGGMAGEVDIEIDHDEIGLPRIRGKRIRSLLRDTWLSMAHCFALEAAAERIFGPPGDVQESAILRFNSAEIEPVVRAFVRHAVKRKEDPVEPLEILRTLTAIRVQTSEERSDGAPEQGALRFSRVARHGLLFHSPLDWLSDPTADDSACLALACLGTRHAGLARNRGRGFVEILLHDSPVDSLDSKEALGEARRYTRTLANVEVGA